jgi:hypothetical protein
MCTEKLGSEGKALMPSFRLGDGVPDLGATVGALINEVDLRQAPMGFDVSHIHRQQPYAAWTDDRSSLDFVMLDVSWHDGSPSQQNSVNFNPAPT